MTTKTDNMEENVHTSQELVSTILISVFFFAFYFSGVLPERMTECSNNT